MGDLLHSLADRTPLPAMCGSLALAAHPYVGVIPQPLFFRAQHGRRRDFLSQADADAYDGGWCSYPGGPIGEPNTPRSQGYFDAEAVSFDRMAGS